MNKLIPFLVACVILIACKENQTTKASVDATPSELSADTVAIYFINDQHGQLDNFAKIKQIVDAERATNERVLLVCAGDIFSGNPIVDQYEEKGYPMIDVMNKTGFDISVIGNHEFDYGPENLKNRMLQAEFEWVCANVDMKESGVPQPDAYKTLTVGDISVTFLGLVETFGKPGAIIPATHPWRVQDMSFERHTAILERYQDLKREEASDVFIALTHLGTSSDMELPNLIPSLDAVIGGHSHQVVGELVNGTPVVQAGSYLSLLGRLELILSEGKITNKSHAFIDLEEYEGKDEALSEIINEYNNAPQFEEVVGFTATYLDRSEIGCFYTSAIKEYLNVDASFQNSGGIRSDIDQGDITTLEIYNMDPFNNGSVIFTLTAGEVEDFFIQTGAGFHISGIDFVMESQNDLTIYDEAGNAFAEDDLITIGINDYIPAVHDTYFPLEKAAIQELTTAETIIEYLKTINSAVDAEGCENYFRL